MIKGFIHIILCNKTLNYLLINLGVMIVMLIYLSNCYIDDGILFMNRLMYQQEYIYESLMFIKFNVVLLTIFTTMNGTRISNIFHLFVARKNHKLVYLNYYISMFVINMIMITIYYVLFIIVGEFLVPYMSGFNYLIGYLLLLIFGCFYTSVSLFVYQFAKNVYVLIGIIVFYLVGSIFTPYLSEVSSFTNTERIIGLVTNDIIIIIGDNNMIYMYGYHYVILFSLSLFLASLVWQIKNDII